MLSLVRIYDFDMERRRYYLFIDECGDQNLANFDPNFPIFTLCGIIVSEEMRDKLDLQISQLKQELWGDKKIILHSRDIRKCQNGFEILFDLQIKEYFYRRINEILGQEGVYTIICCSILKEPYIRQYGKLNDVYAQSLSFLIERSVFYLDSIKGEDKIDLSIIAEKRGKKEDKNLYEYFISLLSKGTYWVTSERLKNYFDEFIFKGKKEDINCLQIADLVAYPVTRHILDPDEVNFSFEIIKGNLYYEGDRVRGLKVIPKV